MQLIHAFRACHRIRDNCIVILRSTKMNRSILKRADLKLLESVGVTALTPRRKEFNCFTILLNEERPQPSKSISEFISDRNVTDDMILKLGNILRLKIQHHSGDNVDMFTADEVIKNNMPTLVSVMFRLAAEDFVRSSKTRFKIIECRNSTKLSTDWKPSLTDVILDLGHQVIIVELCDFAHYSDFAYAVLRQISYNWKAKLPRSVFYPDDVCTVELSNDQQVIIVSPKMPDDDIIDLASRIQDNLKYEIIRMMQESCANGLRNHLLRRDLRVGNFSDTESGLQTICHIYRALQRRLKEDGTNIQMGKTTEDFYNLLSTVAGDSLLAAEASLEYCNNPRPGLTPRKEKRTVSSKQHNEEGGGDKADTPQGDSTQESGNKDDNKNTTEDKAKVEVMDDESILDEILNAVKNLMPTHGKKDGKCQIDKTPWKNKDNYSDPSSVAHMQ